MITRQVRKGYVVHLPKKVMVTGPAEVKVKSTAELEGQEYKLEPVVVTQAITSPQPQVAAMEEPEAARPVVKKKRGQRGRSRIRHDP